MTKEIPMNEMPLMQEGEGIMLFYPNVPKTAADEVAQVLQSRWIGQGPKVLQFEKEFHQKFLSTHVALAVGSGTDALHLAYILADIKPGDEVIVPVFTCTATNIPLLYQGAKIRFADIEPNTLNIDVNHVKKLVNEKTKAIVCVHYGGLPCDMDELSAIAKQYNIPIIEDSAHALGATYKGKHIGDISDFSTFSFQAIKHITTGDGGMLTLKNKDLVEKTKRIRWFGIDRSAKQMGKWENDIYEVGYKYQMTDIAAAMGLAGLHEFDVMLLLRRFLLEQYEQKLANIPGIKVLGTGYTDRVSAAWMCTVEVERRVDFMKKLREYKIETGQVHYRNDRYTIFGGRRNDLPNMDAIEDKYMVLPLHTKMTEEDVDYIAKVIKSGW
ncbi:MAG TPA: DegT/DnrJ/EryC1/StrS family aminotransferase [Bacteroidales bacterium]|nr:DegT/DnrJ/EryC1/StrS family aminotransferase [Bacteroidales bacterium]